MKVSSDDQVQEVSLTFGKVSPTFFLKTHIKVLNHRRKSGFRAYDKLKHQNTPVKSEKNSNTSNTIKRLRV